MKVSVSWSGGKDSCLACYKAIKMGHSVLSLVNFISDDRKRVRFHNIPADLIYKQSESINISLLQQETGQDNYEILFKEAVRSIIPHGIQGMVFGDIYLQEHKQWVTRVCQEMGIEAIEPLWGMRTEDILSEFINSGFEAIVVSAKADAQFGPYGIAREWIGHKVDDEFIRYLKTKPCIDLCGEGGEYHTFVVNGPLFKNPIEIKKEEVIERDTPYGKWYFLDMT
jgi:uncharacterized protein (TIGR00290 family)